MREAGGRALTEQWVVEYMPRKHIRADVWAVTAPGEPVTYFDVVIAHPFTTGVPTGSVGELHTQRVTADAAVGPAARGKRTKYAPPAADTGEVATPRVHMIPLAFDTYGRWGEDAVRALRAAVRRRLARPDARQSVALKGVHGRLLRRWRAAGAIAVQRRNFDVWRDCLSGAAYEMAAGGGGEGSPPDLLPGLLSAGCVE